MSDFVSQSGVLNGRGPLTHWLLGQVSVLLLLAVSCASSPVSEVHVSIQADALVRAQTARLRVVLAGRVGDGAWDVKPAVFYEQRFADSWPREFEFSPKNGDQSRAFMIKVTALDAADRPILDAQMIGLFASADRYLVINLTANCLSARTQCRPTETCLEGSCVDPSRILDLGDGHLLLVDAGVPSDDVARDGMTENSTADADAPDSGGLPDAAMSPDGGCATFDAYLDRDGDGFGEETV